MFALRKALGDTAENGQYIETVAKRGYRFIATVTRASRGHGGSPSPEAVAQAPVLEAVSAGKEFHASGKPHQPPATSVLEAFSCPLRAAARLAAGVTCASGVVLLMVPRKAVLTTDDSRHKGSVPVNGRPIDPPARPRPQHSSRARSPTGHARRSFQETRAAGHAAGQRCAVFSSIRSS